MASIGAILPLVSQAVHAFDRVNPSATSGSSGTPGASDSANQAPGNQLTGDSFIQLLTAQLQSQNPLNPVDPTTFVTQLVQFNQLEQLIDINTTLSAASGATGSSPSASTSNSQAAQISTALPAHSNTAAGL